MIVLKKIRELDISQAATGERPLHLSAASALVSIDETIYVDCDDELHLGVFSLVDRKPGHLVRLFDGVLPEPKAARKRQKPDLEALVCLPTFRGFPHGALQASGRGPGPTAEGALWSNLIPMVPSAGCL